jgi:hypothetical protein
VIVAWRLQGIPLLSRREYDGPWEDCPHHRLVSTASMVVWRVAQSGTLVNVQIMRRSWHAICRTDIQPGKQAFLEADEQRPHGGNIWAIAVTHR